MTDGVPDRPIKDEDSETTHYQLSLRRLLAELEYLVTQNRYQLKFIKEGLKDSFSFARRKKFMEQLMECHHLAVMNEIEKAKEMITQITEEYRDLIVS